ncbi:fumarylacetoacetate hydrolase family protein [Magnetospira sp. QH-2]|uniref:fumarylacetoacetate hydrolase family protein n=1 Tax=Magnetospira sp. (strain QH-2) TaxID=1288970 RepID=UPI0003E80A74|nr:fumarylacetoacetate hydrolase family protein [Magnetospira sp. QH-2]CCQ74289.1 Ureidoglycolate lyase [Magnetospira sp. QH-2]
MRLVRYGPPGAERPGMLDEAGKLRDLTAHVSDIAGEVLCPKGLERLATVKPKTLPEVKGARRLGPPVGAVGKILGIGLNYADHAAEAGLPVPDSPVVFYKSPTALNGPNDPLIRPTGSEKMDWEVELAVIIGSEASYVSEAKALSHVAGYAAGNDVSERAFQMAAGGQWSKGKGCDTFAPLGPWLLTADQVDDPQNLDLWLDVNGGRMQTGNTGTMIFSVAEIIADLSRHMTLLPGDVIYTGTPPGVGMGRTPRVFLQPGDEVRLGVTGLGEQCSKVIERP